MKCQSSLYLPLICTLLFFFFASTPKLKALYNSIDPRSVAQYLAFYELHPNTEEGKQSLRRAGDLLFGDQAAKNDQIAPVAFSATFAEALVALVNKLPHEMLPDFQESDLQSIETAAGRLTNRAFKGHNVKSESEVLQLSPEEIDLSRGLFLSQVEQGAMQRKEMQTIEAMLDLMALQVLAKMRDQSSPEQKISAINAFIFDEMGFRFPPHSVYAEKIDLYTLLPSVIDSRRGVCLGVSILYLCLAERLGLSLEAVTPPGHIYLHYEFRNIETTARGIHLDSDDYLGVNTIALQLRNKKELIGMAHFNQASTYWHSKEYSKALASYKIAEKYLPEDPLLKELIAYTYLLQGDIEIGKELLQQLQGVVLDYILFKDTLADDYLHGETDIEGIRAVFMSVDENRASLLEKKVALKEIIRKYPRFRTGIFQLATTFIQLHRNGEALELLQRYHDLEPKDPTVEYYLSTLHAERLNYPKAWDHLHNVERLMPHPDRLPKVLKALRKEIRLCCPE